ncbi:PrsW family intramembrane metalloprotease [Pseudochryseolinea flava]|uniref:Protease PrsW n=1 Tax=Pseudochryseolinea flava TaxID=2059302 RepID=A0A364YA17_9BACT|nr:PrsW family glutamic-type intramembrane protease [Pseudochryseolinea flava]RAW03265.1 protease PrsW [Pseudochryseolinea flava]
MSFFSLLALALAPGTAIGIYIYLKDKHEREPLGLLLISFFYGALSTIVTLVITFSVTFLVESKDVEVQADFINQFVEALFKVALIEEFSKFIFVRFILFYNRNFNEPFDGIVYAVMVSMGFATLENILYVFQAESGLITGILRMFTAVPAHATFGVLMGYFLGKAKFSQHNSLFFTLVALIAATVFHGSYDYFLFVGKVNGAWAGIWIGALISLITAFFLSRAAIRLHQQSSPFIERAQEKDPSDLTPNA